MRTLALIRALSGVALFAPAALCAPQATEVVVHVGKVLTMDEAGTVHAPGMIAFKEGRITYIGPIVERENGDAPIARLESWATPGLVDLHTHIHSGSFADVNDMVRAVNPELRASPALRAGNDLIARGRAGGVTTLFGIPGSGTNMGGFGIVYKSRPAELGFEAAVVRDPGGLKVAQDSNPQRRNQTDFGVTRAGMSWNLSDVADRALAIQSDAGGDRDFSLMNLARVMRGELPVLIHTAGSEGVVNAARMWKVKYGAKAVISHGSFDGWKTAPALARMGVPVNHGPRTIDYYSTRDGRIVGTGAEFVAAGVPEFSLNTDSSIVPQELFFLQASMSARYGGDPYTMLLALTQNPARSFLLDHRVGSLEPGKDADVVLWAGDPLDPRNRVHAVFIDGALDYDADRDGQRF